LGSAPLPGEGWLPAFLYDRTVDRSSLGVFHAQAVADGPIARVDLRCGFPTASTASGCQTPIVTRHAGVAISADARRSLGQQSCRSGLVRARPPGLPTGSCYLSGPADRAPI